MTVSMDYEYPAAKPLQKNPIHSFPFCLYGITNPCYTAVPNVPKITIYENVMVLENFPHHQFSYLNIQLQNKHVHTHKRICQPDVEFAYSSKLKKKNIYNCSAKAGQINGIYHVLEYKDIQYAYTSPKTESSEYQMCKCNTAHPSEYTSPQYSKPTMTLHWHWLCSKT